MHYWLHRGIWTENITTVIQKCYVFYYNHFVTHKRLLRTALFRDCFYKWDKMVLNHVDTFQNFSILSKNMWDDNAWINSNIELNISYFLCGRAQLTEEVIISSQAIASSKLWIKFLWHYIAPSMKFKLCNAYSVIYHYLEYKRTHQIKKTKTNMNK